MGSTAALPPERCLQLEQLVCENLLQEEYELLRQGDREVNELVKRDLLVIDGLTLIICHLLGVITHLA
jgi:hypothetical protein